MAAFKPVSQLRAGFLPVAAALLLDLIDKSATATGGLFTARTRHAAALLEDGRVPIIGGADGNGMAVR